MCNLYKALNKDKVTGYKVVAKRKGKYYSLAMGFQYKQPEHNFGKRLVQRPITSHFSTLILKERLGLFKKEMVGKTAAFTNLKEAKTLRCSVNKSQRNNVIKEEIVIIKVELTNDLMQGNCTMSRGYTLRVVNVVAGHTMKVIKEIKG